jgi:hypothetical protein
MAPCDRLLNIFMKWHGPEFGALRRVAVILVKEAIQTRDLGAANSAALRADRPGRSLRK